MVDVFEEALKAIATGSPWAWPLALGAGVLSSSGPCITPRVIALSGLLLRSRHRWFVAVTFVAGLLSTYVAFGLIGMALAHVIAMAPLVYGAIAGASFVGAVVTLWGAEWHPRIQTDRVAESIAVAFPSGAAFGLVVSPCCTPLIGIVVSYSAVEPVWWWAPGLMLVFGLGHATPLFLLSLGGTRAIKMLEQVRLSQSLGVVAASLMLAVGVYYALMV